MKVTYSVKRKKLMVRSGLSCCKQSLYVESRMSPSGMCKEEELDKDIELDNRVASMLERRSTPVSSRFACYFSPRTSFLTFA